VTLQHPHAELSAYIDGELNPAARAAVEGHLAACGACRAHVAQLRATAAFVHALPDPVPSRRLVPRLATIPAWLAPLRTMMTLASGTAVFLFIASSLVSNITFLAGGGATTSAQEASRDDLASKFQVPAAAQPAATSGGAPAPAASPNAAFARNPTASPVAVAGDARGAATPSDAAKISDQAPAGPSGVPGAAVPQDPGRLASSEPQRSPLLNPLLWLALALLFGAIAITIQRRLHAV
jgi:anti-sigma factor RsiW